MCSTGCSKGEPNIKYLQVPAKLGDGAIHVYVNAVPLCPSLRWVSYDLFSLEGPTRFVLFRWERFAEGPEGKCEVDESILVGIERSASLSEFIQLQAH